jgi:hypothetical protein
MASFGLQPSTMFTSMRSHKVSRLRGITPSIFREGAYGYKSMDLGGRPLVLVKDGALPTPDLT